MSIHGASIIQATQAAAEQRLSLRTVRAEVERTRLLAFDAVGIDHFTLWMMHEYASLLDERALAGLPTLLTTNLSIWQMREQFGDYLIGRMLKHTQVLHVKGADTRFISVLLETRISRPRTWGWTWKTRSWTTRKARAASANWGHSRSRGPLLH